MEHTKIKNDDYIVMYGDECFGKMEVFMKGKQVWIKNLRSPKLNGPMHYYDKNTFAPMGIQGYEL